MSNSSFIARHLPSDGGLAQPTLMPSTSQLVNRDEQIAQFTDVLKRVLKRRPAPSNLFEWHGGPGIGKSTLVALLLHECRRLGVPSMLLNFKTVGSERMTAYLADPSFLIEDLVADLVTNLPASASYVDQTKLQDEIRTYRESLRQADVHEAVKTYFDIVREERLQRRHPWITALQRVIVEFTALVGNIQNDQMNSSLPVALFFDETEYIEAKLADWIEEWLITPLAQMKQCVVVWTARRPWRWRRPEIRRRLHSEQLQVFAPKHVKQQLKVNSPQHPDLAEMFFRDLHVVTGGHPFANRVAIDQLTNWEDAGRTLNVDEFTAYEPELLTRIFDDFIRGYAFTGKEFDEDLRRACELMSLVRVFDTTMLSTVLTACDSIGGQFEYWRQEDFGYLLQRLKQTQLMIWNKGYAIDPAISRIVRRYFAVCDNDTYLAANRAALGVYQRWLERPVDNRGLFVLEELYHHACLCRAGVAIDIAGEFGRRLAQYHTWIPDLQARRNALERLEGELERDEELAQLIGGESHNQLVEMVKEECKRITAVEPSADEPA